jgi:hypothetical protein
MIEKEINVVQQQPNWAAGRRRKEKGVVKMVKVFGEKIDMKWKEVESAKHLDKKEPKWEKEVRENGRVIIGRSDKAAIGRMQGRVEDEDEIVVTGALQYSWNMEVRP